mgnify:CR=1 FL=1
MKKSMKSKLAMFAVAGAMAVSGVVGIAAPAKAGKITSGWWSPDSTKVYTVYPK